MVFLPAIDKRNYSLISVSFHIVRQKNERERERDGTQTESKRLGLWTSQKYVLNFVLNRVSSPHRGFHDHTYTHARARAQREREREGTNRCTKRERDGTSTCTHTLCESQHTFLNVQATPAVRFAVQQYARENVQRKFCVQFPWQALSVGRACSACGTSVCNEGRGK